MNESTQTFGIEKKELKKSAVAQPFGKALQNKMAKTKGNDTMIPLLRTINALSITLNGYYIFYIYKCQYINFKSSLLLQKCL